MSSQLGRVGRSCHRMDFSCKHPVADKSQKESMIMRQMDSDFYDDEHHIPCIINTIIDLSEKQLFIADNETNGLCSQLLFCSDSPTTNKVSTTTIASSGWGRSHTQTPPANCHHNKDATSGTAIVPLDMPIYRRFMQKYKLQKRHKVACVLCVLTFNPLKP